MVSSVGECAFRLVWCFCCLFVLTNNIVGIDFVMKWSESETLKFVELYHDLECLWANETVNYRNNRMRQAALETLVAEMGMPGFTVDDAKKKIKNLRNTYHQEVAKIEKSKSSGAEGIAVYKPTVKWFTVFDSFMRRISEKRATQSVLATPVSPASASSIINHSQLSFETSEEPIMSCTPGTFSYTLTEPALKKRRRRRTEIFNVMKEQVKECLKNSEEDEFDAFGRVVSISLKKLPLPLALSAQEEIQAVLSKYRLQAFNTYST